MLLSLGLMLLLAKGSEPMAQKKKITKLRGELKIYLFLHNILTEL